MSHTEPLRGWLEGQSPSRLVGWSLLDHAEEDGASGAVVELAELAMQRVEQLAMVVQDSETWSGPRLAESHAIRLRASQRFNPDLDVGVGGSD